MDTKFEIQEYCEMQRTRNKVLTIINDAKTMYKSNSKNAFQLELCWRILRNEAKWLNLRDNVKVHTREPAAQSCLTFASSINLNEDNDEMNSGETLERPIGKKAEK
ncbi:hypothetical protein CFP56_013832 [Quercus suber]|uniref:No apical meristem-associated C-terminal domain-containing protein n=1 Tax=Quercus suber TaxID=58331 RepID=A0AAW0M653_QUESU